jgi:two-component system response regulator DegU
VRKVADQRPDVVLMDITMPRMNGIEATRQLKSRWPDLPVLILTVHDDPVYQRTARAAGADGFLLKKTAGTALWPALTSLVPTGRCAGPEPTLWANG